MVVLTDGRVESVDQSPQEVDLEVEDYSHVVNSAVRMQQIELEYSV